MKTIFKKALITILAVGSFSLISAEEMFVFQTTKITLDDKKGTVYIGTPVEVIKNIDDKNVLVEITGMIFDDKLFTNKDKSLLMASVEKDSFGKNGEIKKVQAVIEKGYLSIVPSEIWEEHEEFYYEMCTQCHASHRPAEHSMLEWDAILQTMSGFAQLYDDEAEYLARYLKANANNGFHTEKK